jgi:hypothetical protein
VNELPVLELKTCPHCGAECDARSQRCWLCHGNVSAKAEIVDAEVVSEPPRHAPSDVFFAVAAGILALVIVLVGVGAALTEPGLAVMMGVVVVPALVATVVRIQQQQYRHGYVSWGERLATFVVSASLVVGVLMLLCVAAVVAFIIFCFAALATGSF